MFAIVVVAAALLVPIAMIQGKINERSIRAQAVTAQFAAESTGPQVVAGPFLALTCEETYVQEREIKRGGNAETIAEQKVRACPTGYFPPRTLKVTGTLPVEDLHRGIYPIRVYRASLEISGEIEWPAPPTSTKSSARVWKKAYLVVSVSDPRGIKSARSTTAASLSRSSDELLDHNFAIQEDLGDYTPREKGVTIPFGYSLQLAGISQLHVAPVGDTTEITLRSSWPHPSFSGGWSPDERRVDSGGFEATWRTTHLATGGQAFWDKVTHDNQLGTPEHAAGVSLVEPINAYSLSYRATEYGFLFILFTFAALALAEVLAGIRLHPVQYALVGSALAVFFLLLIALSEQIAFRDAYLAGATACVLLLTAYLRHSLGSLGRSVAMFILFAGLYGALYLLLINEDHALLLGSVMVFALLAVVMLATRKLDWRARDSATLRPDDGAFAGR
jgi:inner membrane protein